MENDLDGIVRFLISGNNSRGPRPRAEERDALLALRPTEPVQLEGSALQVPFSREARQLYSEKWQKNSSHPNPKSESVTRTATGRSLGGSVGYLSDRSL